MRSKAELHSEAAEGPFAIFGERPGASIQLKRSSGL